MGIRMKYNSVFAFLRDAAEVPVTVVCFDLICEVMVWYAQDPWAERVFRVGPMSCIGPVISEQDRFRLRDSNTIQLRIKKSS